MHGQSTLFGASIQWQKPCFELDRNAESKELMQKTNITLFGNYATITLNPQ